MKKGWFLESFRHSLAARGVKTRVNFKYARSFPTFGSRAYLDLMKQDDPQLYIIAKQKIKARGEKRKAAHDVRKRLIADIGLEEVKKREEDSRREKLLRALQREFPGIMITPVGVEMGDVEPSERQKEVKKELEKEEREKKEGYEEEEFEELGNFSSKRKSFSLTEEQLDKLSELEEQIGAELGKPNTDFSKIRLLRAEMKEVTK